MNLSVRLPESLTAPMHPFPGPDLSKTPSTSGMHPVSDGSLATTGSTWSFTTGSTAVNYTLNASVVGNGAVTLSPVGGTYASGTTVTLTPVPEAGWTFTGWSGDLTGSANPATVTMDD